MSFKGLLFAITFGSGGFPASGAFAFCPDLALVLAIDGSGSVDDRDFALQQTGYAAAFGNDMVQDALETAGIVDVAVVLWGDEEMAPQVLPWRRVAGPEDSALLAHDIAGMQRQVTGDTGIGRGLMTALDLLEVDQPCAMRRIINLSGDGRESHGPRRRQHVPLVVARDRAAEMGVTINGLAITVDAPDLADWYQDRVVTGPGAFVMTAGSFEAFGEAIIRKLAREIASPMLAANEVDKQADKEAVR